jgi:TolB-like protein/class 3 adenylate cyclase
LSWTAELKTVLVSDLVDSTGLVERLGDGRAAQLFARLDGDARALLAAHDGREIDKSDGFLLLFERPISAVYFAMEYHRALATLAAEFAIPLAARVGVHLGEVQVRSNSPEDIARGAKPLEVEGLAKVVAARLMALATPRQTLLTRAAFDLARRSTAGDRTTGPDLEWRTHGLYALKGLTEEVEVCEVGPAGQGRWTHPTGERPARAAPIPSRPGVLVLPFADLGVNGDAAHVSDGFTDEIITSLSGLKSLRVMSRSASMQLKGTTKSVGMLGRELKVEFVLEGSVRRAGTSLRITTHLTRSADEEVLWANRFTGTLDDLFEFQEGIARSVADALEVRLSTQDENRLLERPIPNPLAYELYLRAKQEVYRFTEEALDRALEYLQRGLGIIGPNVTLEAALGYVYWQYVNAGIRPDPAYLTRAEDCARSIFAIAPDAPEGHRLLGLVETHAKRHLQDAVDHLKVALAAHPNDTDSLFWLSAVYGVVGRSSAGYPLVERLLELDPLTSLHHLMPGFLALLDADFARAGPLLRKAYDMEPANPPIAQIYGQLLVMVGDTAGAGAVFDRLSRDAPESFFAKLGRCYQRALARDRAGLEAELTPDVEGGAASDAEYAWNLAHCFAMVGDDGRALDWLRRSVACGNCNYSLLAERDPLLASLRQNADFQALMREVRQAWLAFRA